MIFRGFEDMANNLSDLEALIDLAKEPSSEKRRQLLRDITDVFLIDSSKHTEHQKDNFGDIIQQLSDDFEVETRQEIAERFSVDCNAPYNLMKSFANDVIHVAGSVLKNSPLLSQEDLIEICEQKGQEYLLEITKRTDIGEDLSDAIVENGDDHTVESLLNNENAVIAEETSHKVAERAQTSEILQKPLIKRQDISPKVIAGMYSYVAEELKQTILEKCDVEDLEALENSIRDVAESFSGDAYDMVKTRIRKLSERGELTERKIIGLIKQNKRFEFIITLATITCSDEAVILKIIEDKSGKSLIVLCKANDISVTVFKVIIMSPFIKAEFTPNQVISLVSAYDRFRFQDAQRVMRFWKTRQHALEQSVAE